MRKVIKAWVQQLYHAMTKLKHTEIKMVVKKKMDGWREAEREREIYAKPW